MRPNLSITTLLAAICACSTVIVHGFQIDVPNAPTGFGGPIVSNEDTTFDIEEHEEGQTPTQATPPQGSGGMAPASFSAESLEDYPQSIQNIVRACDGNVREIFDLIRNNVEFQPYFGFRKSPEHTWMTKRGNDADQAHLLVECLRAAGYVAGFEFGLVFIPMSDARAWFGCDNLAALNAVTGSAGYLGGNATTHYAVEQIWCIVVIDEEVYRLAPAYKTYEYLPGIDLEDAMNYSRTGLLAAAGGTETSVYAQGIDESEVNAYLQARAMDLVEELRTNHPAASTDEIISGHRILKEQLSVNLDNGFYPAGSGVSGMHNNFWFLNPYGEYLVNGTEYDFSTHLYFAVGYVNSSGDAFAGAPFILIDDPTTAFTGKKISISFDSESRAEIRVDDELIASETGTPSSNPIGMGYLIQYPFQRSAGTTYDEQKITPIQRGHHYVYAYESGGTGNPELITQRRLRLEEHRRQELEPTDHEMVSESLFLLGLDWQRQFDLVTRMVSRLQQFTPIVHHSFAVVQQQSAFGVDIPFTIVTVPRNGDFEDNMNLRTLIVMGSAMEHGVIEQNYPDYNAVSTVRYVRENNLAGGKTFLATNTNYFGTILADSDLIAGWDSFSRNDIFPYYLASGFELLIPENGFIQLDSLTGNGFFAFKSDEIIASINPGTYNGGFTTTTGFIDFSENVYPWDPTPGAKIQPNPESKDPIDMYSGAYVYDGTDLSLSGDGARGLAFTRSYSSLAAGSDVGLGKGWSHGYQNSIVEHSDVEAALGQSSPLHAASLIAATWAVGDMVNMPDSPKAWVVASLAAYRGLNEIKGNSATVKTDRRTVPFTRIADGTFLPPPGMTATLTRDSGTGLYTLEERFGIISAFNADNKLASITDADGNQMSFAYVASGDGEGALETVTDAYNRTLTFSYTGDHLTGVADSTGRSVTLNYTDGLLTGVTDPEEHTVHYEYDAAERIERIVDKNGQTVANNTYDKLGRVLYQVAEGDEAQQWEYAFTGVRNVEINPERDHLAYVFDAKGRVAKTVDGAEGTTVMEYDGQNQLTRTVDPLGNITRFEYDDHNNLRFIYDARNGASGTDYVVEMQYDTDNRLTHIIDEDGNITEFDYDTNHHLTKITDPLLRETTYTYYGSGAHHGLLETVSTFGSTTSQSLTTTLVYDSNGYPTEITRPDTSVVNLTHNARGDLTFAEVVTTGESNTYPVTLAYDLNRRLLSTTDALSFGESHVLDYVGNVLGATDRHGNTTAATWSPMGRMLTATGPDSQTALYGYDDSGRLSSVTDPLEQVSAFTYDGAGRLVTSANPLDETVAHGYDAAGNRDTLTNARLKSYQFTYTANNLVETLVTPLSRVFTYTYNDRLLLESVEEPSTETVTFSYYDDGRLQQSVDPTGTIIYAYDARGRLQTVSEDTATLTRVYDMLDRVTSFTDSQGNTVGYEWDGGGNLTTLSYPGTKGDVEYVYDNAGRLISVIDWDNRETEFVYDNNSRLAEMLLPNGTVRQYFYDAAGRIERQTDTLVADGSVLLDQRYTYDALGRIKEEIVIPEPPVYTITPTLMTYDDDDRISGWQNGAANVTPVFDADGNMTSGPLDGVSTSFGYDSRNRLTAVGATTFTYDAEDRRISKTEDSVTTTYVHDPHAPLSRLLQKTTGSLTTYYVYVGGQLLYEETDGEITVYHFDARGSTRALSDDTGEVVARVNYGTYGELLDMTGTVDTPFLYNGAYGVQTDGSGLMHMRARYYSPEIRRFVNADPIGFSGGMNWYAYAGSNPIIYLDPSGLVFGTGLSFGEFFRSAASGAGMGSLAFIDGFVDIIPFVDAKPFEAAGWYDSNQFGLGWSQVIGSGTRDALSIITGGSGVGVLRSLPGASRVIPLSDRLIFSFVGAPSAVTVLTGNVTWSALALDSLTTWYGRVETGRQFFEMIWGEDGSVVRYGNSDEPLDRIK